MLLLHEPKCENNDITTIRTSRELHIYWKKRFHKNTLFFRIYADFEADNEKDVSSIGNRTTNIYKQNPVLNGYHIESELEDVLQSSYKKSPLGFKNVDWFTDEVINLENKMSFDFKNTNKHIILTEKYEEDYRNNNICRFCEKEYISDKVGDHCHLTGKNRVPAHSKCKINVAQKQSDFIPFLFHNFSNYDCHMFFRKLVDKKNVKGKFDIIHKTNEEYKSVTYGCFRFVDSYRFLSSSLDLLVKSLVDNNHKTLKNLKNEIVDNDEFLNIVNEIGEEVRTSEDLNKDYRNEIEKLEEA